MVPWAVVFEPPMARMLATPDGEIENQINRLAAPGTPEVPSQSWISICGCTAYHEMG